MSAPRFSHRQSTRAWSVLLALLAGLCLPAAALAQPAQRAIDVQGHRGAAPWRRKTPSRLLRWHSAWASAHWSWTLGSRATACW